MRANLGQTLCGNGSERDAQKKTRFPQWPCINTKLEQCLAAAAMALNSFYPDLIMYHSIEGGVWFRQACHQACEVTLEGKEASVRKSSKKGGAPPYKPSSV